MSLLLVKMQFITIKLWWNSIKTGYLTANCELKQEITSWPYSSKQELDTELWLVEKTSLEYLKSTAILLILFIMTWWYSHQATTCGTSSLPDMQTWLYMGWRRRGEAAQFMTLNRERSKSQPSRVVFYGRRSRAWQSAVINFSNRRGGPGKRHEMVLPYLY